MLKIVSKILGIIFIKKINKGTKINLIVNNNFISVRKIIKINLNKNVYFKLLILN